MKATRGFEDKVAEAFRKMVMNFTTDRFRMDDDFDMECGGMTPLS